MSIKPVYLTVDAKKLKIHTTNYLI